MPEEDSVGSALYDARAQELVVTRKPWNRHIWHIKNRDTGYRRSRTKQRRRFALGTRVFDVHSVTDQEVTMRKCLSK